MERNRIWCLFACRFYDQTKIGQAGGHLKRMAKKKRPPVGQPLSGIKQIKPTFK